MVENRRFFRIKKGGLFPFHRCVAAKTSS